MRAVTASLSILCATAAYAADPASDIRSFDQHPALAALPARWSEMYEPFQVPGVAIVVVDNGVVYGHFWGRRDPVGDKPVNADTMFYIASVTKTFTAAAACKLASEGRLDLDAPVRKYLPRFRLADEQASGSITVRDLLCHRAGITNTPIVLLDAFTGEITDDRYYHFLEQVEPVAGPVYSNEHFTLVGRVIESITGLSWRDYLEQAILLPAGMTRTTGYASRMYADANVAEPLAFDDGKFVPVSRKTDAVMHAAGGLGTTARDAARWLLLTINAGEIGGVHVLDEQLAREMQTLQAPYDEPHGSIRIEEGFGLAWTVGNYAGHKMLSHAGGYRGAGAYFAVLPDDDAGVALLCNSSDIAHAFADIAVIDVLEALTGEPPAWDIYEHYKQRLEQSPPSFPSPEPRPLDPATLSVGADRCAGTYANEWFGTITLVPGPDGLTVSMGQLELRVDPAEGDAFNIVGPSAGGRVALEIDDHGAVTALSAELEEDEPPIRFERRSGHHRSDE